MFDGTIIYIGGSSASGKSSVTNAISLSLSRPIVELDALYHLFRNAECESANLILATRKSAEYVTKKLLRSRTRCIVEGGWIYPRDAEQLQMNHPKEFLAVYCGYPTADPDLRLQQIKIRGEHWLLKLADEDARSFLKNQIELSKKCQTACRALGFPFFDFSEFETGEKELLDFFSLTHPDLPLRT